MSGASILRVLPPMASGRWAWRRLPDVSVGGAAPALAFRADDGLAAIVSVDDCGAVQWLHVSVSRADRLPSWEDLKRAKAAFFGDVLVVQVLPTQAEYVNVHRHCLHLWHNLAGPTLADEAADAMVGGAK